MVGNTAPYTIDDWTEDIKLASGAGIDAFALNIGTDSWEMDQVKNAYDAAEKSGTGFKMFISLDMTVMPCTTADDAKTLRDTVTTFANHTSQFKYNDKAFVSTFSGEKCTFGQSSVAEGWTSQFKNQLQDSVFFVPSFFGDPSTLNTYKDVIDGEYSWNSAWPVNVTTSNLDSVLSSKGGTSESIVNSTSSPLITQFGKAVQNVTESLSYDQAYINALNAMGNKLYMAAVSPWFFTHYSPQTFNKNFIYLSDQLYPSRWQTVIKDRENFPMVEIITWNDYGESHYIGPIKGSQPNSQEWVDGFDHTAWLDLTKYFTKAYKGNGTIEMDQDKIYVWARPHSKNATATSDSVGKPENADIMEDALFAVVLAKSEAEVTLSTSSNNKTVTVPPGLTQLSLPLNPGDTIKAVLSRDNSTVVQLSPGNFTFEANPKTYNFNAFCAMADSSGHNTNITSESSNTTSTSTTQSTQLNTSSSSTPTSSST